MPVSGDGASCLVCSWTYVGNNATEQFEKHMKEHNPMKPAGWLTEADKRFLKVNRLSWGKD
jgi:hypothetical protein